MTEYQYQNLGYRVDLEDKPALAAGATPNASFACGDIDPKAIGAPMGMDKVIKIEDQLPINSCGGNSLSSILEACVWHQSNGQSSVQLSRMFAYANGQRYANIRGDSGVTLKGAVDGAIKDGVPLEQYAPYGTYYYTQFSEEARRRAGDYKLATYAPINDVDNVYEGLAKRIGGAYFGMAWGGQFQHPLPGGFVDEFYESQGNGFHAVCFLDWSTNLDSQGYPRLKLFNSHGLRYGNNGISEWSYKAVQQAVKAQNTTCYFLSDMAFMKPRFDYKKAQWTSV